MDIEHVRREWSRMQEEAACFPQLHYEWCIAWWRLHSRRYRLHLVATEDGRGHFRALAPLCLENRFGVRVLRSMPVHFGDFYDFITHEEGSGSKARQMILDHLLSFASWDCVRLTNVNSQSAVYSELLERGFTAVPLTAIWAAEFQECGFDEYLQSLSANERRQYRKKSRRLAQRGVTELKVVRDLGGYRKFKGAVRSLYEARWRNRERLLPDEYYRSRDAALEKLFHRREATLFLLLFDNRPIAYRLGFLHRGTFYDWKVSHDPRFGDYSPGLIVLGLTIQWLIENGYRRLNFMTGDYRYKRSWSGTEPRSINYELLATRRGIGPGTYRLAHGELARRVKRSCSGIIERGIRTVHAGVARMRRTGGD